MAETVYKLHENFNTLETFSGEQETEECKMRQNPLFIPEITDGVFKFLELQDFKNCRLVCRLWNDVAKEFIPKISTVKFVTTFSPIQVSVDKFNAVFQNIHSTPLNSFLFGQESEVTRGVCRKLGWAYISCQDFFKKWHDKIKELSMINVVILNRRGISIDSYNMGSLLPTNITKLEISCSRSFTPMTFSMEHIRHVKFLKLEECILDCTPEISISPVEIELNFVSFRRDGEIKEAIVTGEFLNLRRIKKIQFTESKSNIVLDMKGCLTLALLVFEHGEIINWEKSKWKIEEELRLQCNIPKTPSLISNQRQYKELDITIDSNNRSILPVDIERLALEMCRNDGNLSRLYAENHSPDLNFLSVNCPSVGYLSDYLSNFKWYTKLRSLFIIGDENYTLTTTSLPINLNKIRLCGPVVIGDILEIDTLVLTSYSNLSVLTQAIEDSKIRVNTLVWELMSYRSIPYIDNQANIFTDEMKNSILKLVSLNLNQFIVGPFKKVSRSKFKRSYYFHLVDKRGEYYCFRKGMGNLITEYQFNDYADIFNLPFI